MGISGYLSDIRNLFPECFVPPPREADHVYVDVNDLLHRSARKCKNSDESLVSLLQSLLDAVLRSTVSARRSILLSADGPAPLAKVATQRSRRCKLADRRELDRRLSKPQKKSAFDTLKLTPGTLTMRAVGDSLASSALRILARSPHLVVEVSGPQSPGEGELKLLKRMYERERHCEGAETYCILGGDADLLVMAIISGVRRLSVIQDADRGPRRATCLSLERFESTFKRTLPGVDPINPRRALALFSMLQGNDYLPSLPFVALRGLWKAYVGLKRSRFATETLVQVSYGDGGVRIHGLFFASVLRGAALDGGKKRTTEGEKCQPGPYVSGILFNLSMYLFGDCLDKEWSYPHSTAPSLHDVAQLCERLSASGTPFLDASPRSSVPSLEPLLCNLVLQPLCGRPYVARPLRHMMDAGGALGVFYARCPVCDSAAADLYPKRASLSCISRKQVEEMGREARAEHERQKQVVRLAERELGKHVAEAHPLGRHPFPRPEILRALDMSGVWGRLSPAERDASGFKPDSLFVWWPGDVAEATAAGFVSVSSPLSRKVRRPTARGAFLRRDAPLGDAAPTLKCSSSPPPPPPPRGRGGGSGSAVPSGGGRGGRSGYRGRGGKYGWRRRSGRGRRGGGSGGGRQQHSKSEARPIS